MFRKLVSNLPFQPSLLSDIAFYTHRLKQENSVRRIGLLLVLIGFGIQIFAIAYPPQASLATNTDDIIYGATTKADVLSAYVNNSDPHGRKDIKAIFDHYGIGQEQIEKSTKTTIKDSGKNYINTSRGTTKWDDTFVSIPDAIDGGIYEFPLSYWRKNEYPNGYPALTGVSTYGFRFWILLKGCGNIVFEKGAKKPALEINKKLISNDNIVQGSEASYKIMFRNTGAIAAKDAVIKDMLPEGFEYVSQSSSINASFTHIGNLLTWNIGDGKKTSLSTGTKWQQINLTVRATEPVAKKQCNSVSIDAANASPAKTVDQVCVTVTKPTCPGTGLEIPVGGVSKCVIDCPDGSKLPYDKACSTPQATCSNLNVIPTATWNKRAFIAATTSQPGATVESVTFYVNEKNVAVVTNKDSSGYYNLEYVFPSEGTYAIRSDVQVASGQSQASQNCQQSEEIVKPSNEAAMIVTDKKVKNVTQSIEDANNTTAMPGDSLEYSIIIKNEGNVTESNLSLSGDYAESISDVLEYADVVDLGDGALNKETYNLSWPAVTINPGESVVKKFTVRVKNPLPTTPISLSNPLSFDYEMHNKYGRTVVVKLPKPASKSLEESVSILPSTGPTSTTLLYVLIVSVVAYFYFRNRLMAKELKIIQREFQTGGM